MLPELYHSHHSRHPEDLPFWLELAAHSSDPILELGCGTGRVLVPLAQAGHRTIGLDRDPGMLKFFEDTLDPLIMPRPSLIVADISRFSLAQQFSLIILPCNTLSTLEAEQRRECLGCVHRHLQSGGKFAVSLPNPHLLSHLPGYSEVEFEDEFILPSTGNPVQVSSSWRRTKGTFIVSWIYDQLYPDGRVERLTTEISHQIIPAQAYLDDIQAVGLKVESLYGDSDRSEYTDNSPSMIILATG